nr:NADH dehydrogenase subunit 2 [Platydemus manokwari]
MGYVVSESVFVYYILNTLSFILFLWGILFLSEDLVILSFFLKLGFFPFAWWFPYISDSLNYFSFFVLSVVQKLVPLCLFFWNNSLCSSIFYFAVFVNVLISLINLVYNQNNVKVFLAWSSSINFSWILVIFFQRWTYGISYYFYYILVFSFFIYALSSENCFWDQICVSNSSVLLVCIVSLCAFSGFPPFLGFFYKLIFFSSWSLNFFLVNVVSSLVWVFLFSLLFAFNSFVYINMLFKLNVNKWYLSASVNSSYLVYFFFLFILFSFSSIYI